MNRLLALLALAVLPSATWPHGGEDHSHDTTAVAPADLAPRAFAQSEEFELVAVLAEGKLILYLDRYADNAPVPDAEIEVESGTFKAVATQVAPGLYAVPGQAFARPDKYSLTISVQAGDASDLLTTALVISAPVAGIEHLPSWDERAVWGAAGVLLLAGAGLVAVRRRKMHRKQHH